MTKSKVYSLILSVTIAFGLWLYVVNNVSQNTDVTFNGIPVVREGEARLAEKNMMVTGISASTVSVNLSGARNDLNKVDASNLSAKIDLSKIDGPGEKQPLNFTLSYPADVNGADLDESERTPSLIYVDVDYRRTLEIPVRVKWVGTRSEDVIYDTENYTLDTAMVGITGPAAVADTIAYALIEIDLTERTESISESFRYTLCDKDGNPVDAQKIITNVEQVRLEAQIHSIREVDLVADLIYGGGATKENTIVRLDPEVIRVSGGEGVLEELGDTFSVCSINLADVNSGTAQKYIISLPEGVTNQTGVNEVTVTVQFTGLKTADFTVSKIQMVNVPKGMEAEIINASLAVKVRGPAEQIEKMTAEDISVVVDFSAAEVGTATYKAAIVLGDAFSGVGALKTYSVSATVQAAQEES